MATKEENTLRVEINQLYYGKRDTMRNIMPSTKYEGFSYPTHFMKKFTITL